MPATITPLPRKRKVAEPIPEWAQTLHDCVHAVGEKVEAVGERVGELGERVAKVEGYQAGIATRVGVPQEGEKPKHPIGFMGRGKFLFGTAAAVFGALSAFAAFYPVLANVARGIHESLLISAG